MVAHGRHSRDRGSIPWSSNVKLALFNENNAPSSVSAQPLPTMSSGPRTYREVVRTSNSVDHNIVVLVSLNNPDTDVSVNAPYFKRKDPTHVALPTCVY